MVFGPIEAGVMREFIPWFHIFGMAALWLWQRPAGNRSDTRALVGRCSLRFRLAQRAAFGPFDQMIKIEFAPLALPTAGDRFARDRIWARSVFRDRADEILPVAKVATLLTLCERDAAPRVGFETAKRPARASA